MRVVLVGSLHLAGQNILALEQCTRLPGLCVGEATFKVTYLTTARDGPLAPLLREAGIELRRYEVNKAALG